MLLSDCINYRYNLLPSDSNDEFPSGLRNESSCVSVRCSIVEDVVMPCLSNYVSLI